MEWQTGKKQRYHPDKNANDPKAIDMFNEITFSYNILSDPDKRHQYGTAGFEAVDSKNQDLELDLSSLGAVNTMFAAIFSKLGVPIKTTVSATLLEEALHGTVTIEPIELGQPIVRKAEKQCAYFYSVTITEQQAQAGLVQIPKIPSIVSVCLFDLSHSLITIFDYISLKYPSIAE